MTHLTTRREFLKHIAAGGAALALAGAGKAGAAPATAKRPNILWITCEDIGPSLGCFGDSYAITPNLDKLAARGAIYTNAWSTAPVCAPTRTSIISGMFAPALGGEHMRSQVPLPKDFKLYPAYLRQAGYYCSNNSKTDYNLAFNMEETWDDCSGQAHWKNRPAGAPFFAIFNDTITHESQIRNAIPDADRVHDPAKAHVPAFQPDTPEVRKDWAQYYDRITTMDKKAGKLLAELEESGLAEDTIVFFYGDHGSGMPRFKRTPYDSGLHVGIIVYVPEKWKALAPAGYQAGGKLDRLVNFYDLGPTVLSLAGVKTPPQMHGHAFMGQHATPEPELMFGFRGRMDERYDLVRVCRDKRYIYVRNFMPHKPYGQHIDFQFQTPTTRIWKQMFDEGKLNELQSRFWKPKPAEELYDLQQDPEETKNLAGLPEHQERLERMRAALKKQLLEWRDVGFLPEGQIHSRSKGSDPWTVGHDDARYPMAKIYDMADLASSLKPESMGKLVAGFGDSDSAVRYWAAMGLLMRGAQGVDQGREALRKALKDEAAEVRIIAAEALGRYGEPEDVKAALELLVEHADLSKQDTYTALLALNALQAMVDRAAPVKEKIAALPAEAQNTPPRLDGYAARALGDLRADLGIAPLPGAANPAEGAPKGKKGRKKGKKNARKAQAQG